MKQILFSALFFAAFYVSAAGQEIHKWYAGTQYVGTVVTSGLVWQCSGGTCVLEGPYGTGLNMQVCQELSQKVGGLEYYYNDAGMIWSKTENSALLKQCNGR